MLHHNLNVGHQSLYLLQLQLEHISLYFSSNPLNKMAVLSKEERQILHRTVSVCLLGREKGIKRGATNN